MIRLAPPRLQPRGSVLIVVLWACLGLVSVTLLFGHSMLMSYRGADNDLAGRQADQAIEGSARYVLEMLGALEKPGTVPELTSYQSEALTVGDATVWMLGRADQSASALGATASYGLVDEASKLNLNTATQDMLKALPGMTDELAASILDWRDSNDEISAGGAESEVYLKRQPPHACKNGPFESIEELALVQGATRAVLYGEDANLNGVLDSNEDDGGKSLPEDNADGKLDAGIFDYVTVFSRESNKKSDGTARVSVAKSSKELNTLLDTTFGASRAQQIRQRLGQATPKSVLEFYIRGGLTWDEFAKIGDSITATTGDYVPGRINVNTASEAVLTCIPGIGSEKAATLLAARLTRTQSDADMTWVVATLGNPGAIQAGPYITGQSFQFSADLAAVGRHGRGYRRAKFVFDTSTGTARIIYRRNLAPLGWALGGQVRESFAMKKEPS